jgi:guanine deaminase
MKIKPSNKFMKSAIELSIAHMAKGAGGPFGAVVVKDGKIISEGWNQVTSKNDPTAHAEIVAIRKACELLSSFDLSGTEIYTSCEPCPMCLSAIYWARIDKIYYANTRKDAAKIDFDDDFLYSEISKKISKRKIPMQQLMRDEALKAFSKWNKKTNKVKY